MVLIEDLDSGWSTAYNSKGQPKLPAVIITGPPGSGKSTFVRRILRVHQWRRLAVVNENEPSSAPQHCEDIARWDSSREWEGLRKLASALAAIAEEQDKSAAFDGVVVELSGAADPGPVLQSLLAVDAVADAFYVDNVIAVADCAAGGAAAAQLAFAGLVILNKVDAAPQEAVFEVERKVKAVNGAARVELCCYARVESAEGIFNVSVFSLGRALLDLVKLSEGGDGEVSVSCGDAVSLPAFQALLDGYLGKEESARDFLRVKAVLNIQGSGRKYAVQTVRMVRTMGFCGSWEENAPRESRVVFVGVNIGERRESLKEEVMACVAKPLRFAVGETVHVHVRMRELEAEEEEAEECQDRCDDGCGCSPGHGQGHKHGHRYVWLEALVLSHWESCHAYKVSLQDGGEALIPLDDDGLVRRGPPPADALEG